MNPLAAFHSERGAALTDAGFPRSFGTVADEYRAAREGGVADWGRAGLIRVIGPDRVDFLNRLTSNKVDSTPGHAVHTFLLTVQARPLVEIHALTGTDLHLLEVPRELSARCVAELDKFHFSEKLRLEDLSATWTALCLLGSKGPSALGQPPLEPGTCAFFERDGQNLARLGLSRLSVQAELVFAPVDQARELWGTLSGNLAPVGEDVLEILRVEQGTPRYARDYDDDTLFLEMADPDSYSEKKGCYPGQEVVARILHRGHVNRRLVGLSSEAPVPEGEDLLVEDKKVGWTTSSALSPDLGPVALGYVRREHFDPGTPLQLASGQVVTVRETQFGGNPAAALERN